MDMNQIPIANQNVPEQHPSSVEVDEISNETSKLTNSLVPEEIIEKKIDQDYLSNCIADNKKNEWSRPDKIARIGIYVNAIMALITLAAVLIAFDASKSSDESFNASLKESKKFAAASIKAANVAESSFLVTRKAIDSANSHFLKSIEISKIVAQSANKSTLLAESGLNEQIKMINTVQKQFTLSNEPFLQIKSFSIDTFMANKPIYYSYTIENLGNYPIKILTMINGIANKYIPPNINDIPKLGDEYKDAINTYVIKGDGIKHSRLSKSTIPSINIEKTFVGEIFVYFYGIIKYQNLITKEIKNYNFCIKNKFDHNGSIEPPYFLINENVN